MLSGWAYVKLATQQRIQTRTAMEIRPVLHVRLVPTQLPPLVTERGAQATLEME